MKHSPSNRIQFQWDFVDAYYDNPPEPLSQDKVPLILNIGCADDPCKFGELVHHVDIDDWSYLHKWFTQSNAEDLAAFPSGSQHMVILGDILEHTVHPIKVVDEACRVLMPGGILVMTIFEEWRLSSPGQHIEEAIQYADELNRSMGYEDREDYQHKNYPQMILTDDDITPHLCHINQFTAKDIASMSRYIHDLGFDIIKSEYMCDAIHEGHNVMNWLLAFGRNS